MKHEDGNADTLGSSGGSETQRPAVADKVFGRLCPVAQRYHDSLATDGVQRGFIGPREVSRLWERHILNCALVAEALPCGVKRVVDVGSGAGLPGIPLALARPELHITLLEPLLKRSRYLLEIVDSLGLPNVAVVRGRAEDKEIRRQLHPFDVATSRAVAPLGRLAAWSLPLVHRGGWMVALKGASVKEELRRDSTEIGRVGGGHSRILTVGEGIVQQPATVITIQRRR